MGRHEYSFFPMVSHAQFYLGDDDLGWDPSTCWDDEASALGLALMDEALGIATVVTDECAAIVVALLDAPPAIATAPWDRVIDCSIDVPSGCLRISTVPDGNIDPPIRVAPGTYRARIYWGNVHAMHGKLDGLDDPHQWASTRPREGEGRDRYRIDLWSAERAALTIRKRLEGPLSWG